jgi:hypothetical protein
MSVRFNRGKYPDEVRKAVSLLRKKEGASLRKSMTGCIEDDCGKLLIGEAENQRDYPTGRQEDVACDAR